MFDNTVLQHKFSIFLLQNILYSIKLEIKQSNFKKRRKNNIILIGEMNKKITFVLLILFLTNRTANRLFMKSMKKIKILSIFLLIYLNASAQLQMFSDSTEYSLLTCSPGQELYSSFGHTGIRVNDTINKIDIVFNYGLFNFNTENFYLKFIKGETDYQLGITTTSAFLAEYLMRESYVWEQKLNFSTAEKKKFATALIENYKPENRVYRYNFIYDNCATRPRDRIFRSCDGMIKFEKSGEQRTFRNWVGLYTGAESWVQFGIDLLFGRPADANATVTESMFLPEVLMSEFQNIKIIRKDSLYNEENLVSETIELVEGKYPDTKTEITQNPLYFFLLLLFLGIIVTIWETRTNHYLRSFDSFMLLVTGVAGLLVFYLMFFSVHPMVKTNMNILWLNPFNIFAAILIWIKPLRFTVFIYKIVNITLLLVVLILFAISFQTFNTAVFPLILLLFMRYVSYIINAEKAQVRILKKRAEK